MCQHNGLSTPCGNCYSYAPPYIRSCDQGCNNTGCILQLDASCVIYHKDNNTLSQLRNLNLPNGSTAGLIFDAIDVQLGQIQAQNFSLTCLRGTFSYVINGMQQFAEAVDTILCTLNTSITAAATPLSYVASNSILLTFSGALNHAIQPTLKVSATANNQLQVLSDGVFVEPQTLDIDYSAKTLTISDGNTVDFGSLLCQDNGWLGNLTADPSVFVDGNYWYNTTSSTLKISVHGGNIKTITIT